MVFCIVHCMSQSAMMAYINVQCILDCLSVSASTEPVHSDDQFANSYWNPYKLYINVLNHTELKNNSVINHHCWLHDAMHNASPHPLCKRWNQFIAYDEHFDWLQIVSRYNWPMVKTVACLTLFPSDDHQLWSGKICFSNPRKYMPM